MKNAISPLMSQPKLDAVTSNKAPSSNSDEVTFNQALNESQKEVSQSPQVKDKQKSSAHSDTAGAQAADPNARNTSNTQSRDDLNDTVVKPAAEFSQEDSVNDGAFPVLSTEAVANLHKLVKQLQNMLGDGEQLEGIQGEINPEKLASLLASLEQLLDQQNGNPLPYTMDWQSSARMLEQLSDFKQALQAGLSATMVGKENNALITQGFAINSPLNSAFTDRLRELASFLEKALDQLNTPPVKLNEARLLAAEPLDLKSTQAQLNQSTQASGLDGLQRNINAENLSLKQPEGQFDGLLAEKMGDRLSNAVKDLQDIHSHLVRQTSETSQVTNNQNLNSPLKAQLSVPTPFQQAEWGQGVAERVMWMSSRGLQEAEIHLDPPELGPLQVKVSIANEQAHVSFVVQHGSVREALDQHAMRLREMFDAEGIDLVDVDVSDQSSAQDENGGSAFGDASQDVHSEDDNTLVATTSLVEGSGLVNTYV